MAVPFALALPVPIAPVLVDPVIVPEGVDPLTTTEATHLQTQLDEQAQTISNLQAALGNAQNNQTAILENLTSGSTRQMIDANTAALAVPVDGETIDTGQVFEGRKVFATGVSQASVGGVASGGTPTVLFGDVEHVTEFQIILLLTGTDGQDYEVQSPYFDANADVAAAYTNHRNGLHQVEIINYTTDTVKSWWGTVRHTKASNP